MKKLIFITLLFLTNISFAYYQIRVINPEKGFWSQFPAIIQEAEISVRPVGAFTEYNLYLTFTSANTENEGANAQLEVIMDFELPNNSIITDSWLWINGEPKQAEILDRWTATNIYEEIVSRRKDPSLLVKNGPNQYSINIYPMKPGESRKIKITYLAPSKYMDHMIISDIPAEILNLTSNPLQNIQVYFLPSIYAMAPVSENTAIDFEDYIHAELGECIKTSLPRSEFNTHNIKLPTNKTSDITCSKYIKDQVGFYEISFTPSDLFTNNNINNKICYLIDFDQTFFNGNRSELLKKIESAINNTLSENDEFNIIFSNLSLTQAFNNWTTASTTNIEQAFSNAQLSNYSNLEQLLAKGINFVNENGDNGKLVLLSNNNDFKSYQNANELINDLKAINQHKITINTIDFTNKYGNSYWINNRYYYGNGYFYSNLARTNSGEYINFVEQMSSRNFDELLKEAILEVSDEVISNIDIYTSNNTGYCYGRFNVTGGLSSSNKLNKTIHQIGKYHGDYPSSVEISFEMNQQVYYSKMDIVSGEVLTGDSLIKTIWSGTDILQMEQNESSLQAINEIIYQSIENRILSRFTAFLCVEDSIEICDNCGDEWVDGGEWDPGDVIVGKEDFEANESIFVYPNPFQSVLKIDLPELGNLQSLKIYNMMGQCVKTFEPDQFTKSFEWDGNNNEGSREKEGIYLIVATFENQRITTKVIKR